MCNGKYDMIFKEFERSVFVTHQCLKDQLNWTLCLTNLTEIFYGKHFHEDQRILESFFTELEKIHILLHLIKFFYEYCFKNSMRDSVTHFV